MTIKFGKLYIAKTRILVLKDDKLAIGYDDDKKKYYCDERKVKEAFFVPGDVVMPFEKDGPLRAKILFGDKRYLCHIDNFQSDLICMET